MSLNTLSLLSQNTTHVELQHTLLQTMPEGVFVACDGHFVFANEAMSKMLGHQHQTFLSLGFAEVVAAEYLGQWKYLMEQGTARRDGSFPVIRVRLQKADPSEEVWAELHVSLMQFEGRPCALGVVRDITQRRRAEQHSSLRDHVLEQLARGAGLESVLHAIVFATEEVVANMCCAVLMLDASGEVLRRTAAPNLPMPLALSLDGMDVRLADLCGLCALPDQVNVCSDLAMLDASVSAPLALQAGLHALWSAPVQDVSGEVCGVFVAYFNLPRTPLAADIALLQQAVNLAGVAVERKRAQEELRLASLVYETSAEGMMVIDERARVLAVNPALLRISGYASEELIGTDARQLPLLRKLDEALGTKGQWQGEVWSRRKNGDSFICWVTINSSLDMSGTVQRRVVLFSDITNRKQSEELIWRQANFDMLTQLPNRNMFQDRLAQQVQWAASENGMLALLAVDLDKFQQINETHGSHQGDAVLVETARRIRHGVGAVNTVARVGSNEFMVILADGADSAQVDALVVRLMSLLSAPYLLEAGPVMLTASMGVAWYPTDACDGDALLSHTSNALQVAKSRGGNQCCHFTSDLLLAAQARTRLVRDMREAINEQQFVLFFQPIVDVYTGEIHKAEALLRWHHPQLGVVSPADFIPLAEETGMIVEIGNWVFEEAARWAKRWRETDPLFQVSINKSPAQFDPSGRGTQAWLDFLKELELPGEAIVIEITEGLLLHSEPHVVQTMAAYRAAGIQLAIDDFGTGYSALSYLKKFNIDYLKIDQSFTRNLTDDSSELALCEAIVVMAHRLGLKVVAEGLETEGQRGLLSDMGCDLAQGYLFARPMAAQALESVLAANAAGLQTAPVAQRAY